MVASSAEENKGINRNRDLIFFFIFLQEIKITIGIRKVISVKKTKDKVSSRNSSSSGNPTEVVGLIKI